MYAQSGPERRKTCEKLMHELPLSELELSQQRVLAEEIERTGKGLSGASYAQCSFTPISSIAISPLC